MIGLQGVPRNNKLNFEGVVLDPPASGQQSGLAWTEKGHAVFSANTKLPRIGAPLEKGQRIGVRFSPQQDFLLVSQVIELRNCLTHGTFDKDGRVQVKVVLKDHDKCRDQLHWDPLYHWIKVDEKRQSQVKNGGCRVLLRYTTAPEPGPEGGECFWKIVDLMAARSGSFDESSKENDDNEGVTVAHQPSLYAPAPIRPKVMAPRPPRPVRPPTPTFTSLAVVTQRTSRYITMFLYANSQAAFCNPKHFDHHCLSVGAHFNCQYSVLDKPIEKMRFKVTNVLERVETHHLFINVKKGIRIHNGTPTEYHEAEVLMKVDFSKGVDQFSKLKEPNHMIKSSGIVPYVLLAKNTKDEDDKNVSITDLLKKYNHKIHGKLIGWCNFEPHVVPRMMIDRNYQGEDLIDAYSWKLDRIVGHEEMLEWLERHAMLDDVRAVVDKLVADVDILF